MALQEKMAPFLQALRSSEVLRSLFYTVPSCTPAPAKPALITSHLPAEEQPPGEHRAGTHPCPPQPASKTPRQILQKCPIHTFIRALAKPPHWLFITGTLPNFMKLNLKILNHDLQEGSLQVVFHLLSFPTHPTPAPHPLDTCLLYLHPSHAETNVC